VLRGDATLDATPDERRTRLELVKMLSGRSFQAARADSVRQRANGSAKSQGPLAVRGEKYELKSGTTREFPLTAAATYCTREEAAQ
jgi:hypothetical protein